MRILETERLILRPITEDDAGFTVELLNSPSFLKYIGDRGVKTEEEARAYLHKGPLKSERENGFGLFVLISKESGVAIGTCSLVKRDGLEGEVDLGFALLPEFEGKGYGFESSVEVMRFAKEELGLNRLVAIAVSYNKSSIHLLEKLGFSHEKMIKLPGDEEELMLFGVKGGPLI